jgi:hypothetical protein
VVTVTPSFVQRAIGSKPNLFAFRDPWSAARVMTEDLSVTVSYIRPNFGAKVKRQSLSSRFSKAILASPSEVPDALVRIVLTSKSPLGPALFTGHLVPNQAARTCEAKPSSRKHSAKVLVQAAYPR